MLLYHFCATKTISLVDPLNRCSHSIVYLVQFFINDAVEEAPLVSNFRYSDAGSGREVVPC